VKSEPSNDLAELASYFTRMIGLTKNRRAQCR